jgi:hypothetical protein
VRRLLAAVAAVAMLVAGYAVYLVRTDSQLPWKSEASSTAPTGSPTTGTGSNAGTGVMRFEVSCVPEAEDACASVDNVGESAFIIESPASTEKAYGEKADDAPDAWLTTSLGYERIRFVRRDLRLADTVASSRIMVVTRSGATNTSPNSATNSAANSAATCAAKLACVARAGRVAFPALSTGAGLWIATSAVESVTPTGEELSSVDDLADGPAVLQGIRTAKKLPPVEALSNLVSIRVLDAVVMPEVSLRSVSPSGVDAKPAFSAKPISYVLVVSKNVSDSQAKQLATSLQESMKANGFDPPVASTPLPNPGLANDINQRLR